MEEIFISLGSLFLLPFISNSDLSIFLGEHVNIRLKFWEELLCSGKVFTETLLSNGPLLAPLFLLSGLRWTQIHKQKGDFLSFLFYFITRTVA
jgi:hypothetical protein